MHIRSYQKSDWPDVCQVHDAARSLEVSAFMPSDEVFTLAEAAEEDGFFDSECFVACVHHQVVGFIGIEPPMLTWLYVSPTYHRQGIGRSLMHHVLPKLGKNAYLTTALENADGVAFYQAMGFRISATFPGSCQGCACTCVRLTWPGGDREAIPPKPVKESLVLAGYDDTNPGQAIKDESGIWRWI